MLAAMSRQGILQGPVVPAVAALALPVIAGEALHAGFHLADMV